ANLLVRERALNDSKVTFAQIIILPLVAAILINFGQLYLLALGFSVEFFAEATRPVAGLAFYQTDLFRFAIITAIPFVLHAVVITRLMRISPALRGRNGTGN
ncbi:MAG: hypothetical protein ABI459_11730, partial [Deltaproteobacteria bacterium]